MTSKVLPETYTNDQVKMTTFPHKWIIDNFPARNLNEEITSFTFPPITTDSYRFDLRLRKIQDSIFLLCYPKSFYCSKLYFIQACILDKNGLKKNLKEKRGDFSQDRLPVHRFPNEPNHTYLDFFKYEDVLNPENGLLQNNSLTIYCEVNILESVVKSPTVASLPLTTNSLIESIGSLTSDQALADLKSLLTSGKLSDIVLVVGGQSIPAHKAILSARSKVFAAMLEYDSKEKQENRVVITDVKAQVFGELLQFIYTGKITSNVLDQYAEELLAAADKYQLDSLKDNCESVLCLKLSIESSPSFLVLADMHNAQKLKAKALEFIRNNTNDTIQAVFNSNNSELVVEAFRDLANKFANKKN